MVDSLRQIEVEANQAGYPELRLEAVLARLEIELARGGGEQTRQRLNSLRLEAEALGQGLISRKAEAALLF